MEIRINGLELEDGALYLNLGIEFDGEAYECAWDILGNCFDFSPNIPWELKNILRDTAEHKLMNWTNCCVRAELAGLMQQLSERFAETRISIEG